MQSGAEWTTADDGARLRLHHWRPDGDGPVRAHLHIVHGLSDHAARYAHVAVALAAQGLSVSAHDQRGHGETAQHETERGHFADTDGWSRVVRDLVQICRDLRSQTPGRPLILLGHSLGAYLVQQVAFEHGELLDGIAMSGVNGRISPLMAVGGLVARIERLRLGRRGRSALLQRLSYDGFNRPFAPNRTPFDWLSRDAAEVARYVADPRCGFAASTQSWVDILAALGPIARDANRARVPKGLPVYLFNGSADPVGEFGRGPAALERGYRRQGLRNLQSRLYPEARHELFRETNRDEVLADLLVWLETLVAVRPQGVVDAR